MRPASGLTDTIGAESTDREPGIASAVAKSFIGASRPQFVPGAGAATADPRRGGAVTVWACLSALWLVLIGQVMFRWVTSTDGFCTSWAAVTYFLPWSWLSVSVDSDVTHLLPSYLLPSRL